MLSSNKPYPVMNFLKNLYRNFGLLIVFFITLPLGLLANEPIDRSKAYQDLRDEMSALSQRISEIKLENQRRIQQLKAITIDVAEKEEAPPKAQELILRDQDFTREIINRNDQNKNCNGKCFTTRDRAFQAWYLYTSFLCHISIKGFSS
jgi:hypothetical protein